MALYRLGGSVMALVACLMLMSTGVTSRNLDEAARNGNSQPPVPSPPAQLTVLRFAFVLQTTGTAKEIDWLLQSQSTGVFEVVWRLRMAAASILHMNASDVLVYSLSSPESGLVVGEDSPINDVPSLQLRQLRGPAQTHRGAADEPDPTIFYVAMYVKLPQDAVTTAAASLSSDDVTSYLNAFGLSSVEEAQSQGLQSAYITLDSEISNGALPVTRSSSTSTAKPIGAGTVVLGVLGGLLAVGLGVAVIVIRNRYENALDAAEGCPPCPPSTRNAQDSNEHLSEDPCPAMVVPMYPDGPMPSLPSVYVSRDEMDDPDPLPSPEARSCVTASTQSTESTESNNQDASQDVVDVSLLQVVVAAYSSSESPVVIVRPASIPNRSPRAAWV